MTTRAITYRLADSIAVEPLINQWAVWADIISPAPFSLHMLNYQIKMMASYLANPEMHVKASRDPKFLGGPFIDIPAHRASEIEKLLNKTQTDLSENLRFAKAIIEYYGYLDKEAQGQSLEPFYEKAPELLRGYVELAYDYYNHPILKLFESLLFKSPYYKKNIQSLRIFNQLRDNSRRFFLNTPRLREEDQIDWAVPFDSPCIDELFKLDLTPRPVGHISEILGLNSGEQALLQSFVTTEPSEPQPKWTSSYIRIRYFGHACVLVEWAGISILTDPWIGVISEEESAQHFTYKDLPEKIDYALITHGHHDHLNLETLLRLRHRIDCLVVPRSSGLFYADPSLKLVLQQCGFKQVVEIDSLESIKLPDAEIVAVPFLGEHADLAHAKTGFIVRIGKEQILFAADSNCLDKSIYQHLRRLLGPIETVFLGMECVGAPLTWLYGALLPVKPQHSHSQSRRTKGCDASAALDLLESVGSKRVYIYAMGNEPWLQYRMGMGPAENSPQILEAEKALAKSRANGFIEAKRLYLQFETFLGSH